MRKISPVLAMLAALSMAIGCGKKDEDRGGGADEPPPAKAETEAAEKPEKEAPKAPASPAVAEDTPFAAYGLAEIASKWNGAWVVGASLGRKAAWEVDGAKVKSWNGTKEETLEFQILAPCYSKTSDKAAGSSTFHVFAFDGDTLYAGLGHAGVITDKGAVACAGGYVYELVDGACTKWRATFGKWKSSEVTCTLADGVLTVEDRKLDVVGKAAVNQQMKGNKAEKHDSYDAAKAAVAK